MMAKREHRMHHWLWHEVRNNWHLYPRDIQQKIEELGCKAASTSAGHKAVIRI